MQLHCQRGGEGADLLVLIHGLSANADVWAPLIEAARFDGRWLAPDLRGHGRSPWGSTYDVDAYAQDIAALIAAEKPGGRVILLGHSMGGVIAFALASGRFGVSPARAFALGVKVRWSEAEIAKLAGLAALAPKIFATREDALDRYFKSAGLSGLLSPEATDAGIAQAEGGWRLAADPKTFAIAAPDMAALRAEAKAPTHLACGARDPMVDISQLRAIDSNAEEFDGLGHNAMIESPRAVWAWVSARV